MAANNSNANGVCTDAIRKSVAKTQKGYGNAVAASAVFSTTQDLRVAYPSVECNAPAVA